MGASGRHHYLGGYASRVIEAPIDPPLDVAGHKLTDDMGDLLSDLAAIVAGMQRDLNHSCWPDEIPSFVRWARAKLDEIEWRVSQ